MTSFLTPRRFSYLKEKNYFCPHIAENSQYRRIFPEKNFRRYWVPPCSLSSFNFRSELIIICPIFQIFLGRFEIRNFKTQKWVSMFLSYLVENFFLVILRARIFFVFEISLVFRKLRDNHMLKFHFWPTTGFFGSIFCFGNKMFTFQHFINHPNLAFLT
jgi:hypothetical protein